MKHNLIISIFILPMLIIFSTTLSNAQIHVGLRGGLNASKVSFKNLPDRSEKYGFHLGVLLDVTAIPDFLSVQPEVSFSTKGTNYDYLGDRQTITMNSMDLLLPVAFKLGSVGLQVGPFASYLLQDPKYTELPNNTVIVDGFRKLDAGLTAGISFNFSKMFLAARYNQGLVNVSNDNIIETIGEGKNAVAQLSIGVIF